jgi:hypothetical protein
MQYLWLTRVGCQIGNINLCDGNPPLNFLTLSWIFHGVIIICSFVVLCLWSASCATPSVPRVLGYVNQVPLVDIFGSFCSSRRRCMQIHVLSRWSCHRRKVFGPCPCDAAEARNSCYTRAGRVRAKQLCFDIYAHVFVQPDLQYTTAEEESDKHIHNMDKIYQQFACPISLLHFFKKDSLLCHTTKCLNLLLKLHSVLNLVPKSLKNICHFSYFFKYGDTTFWIQFYQFLLCIITFEWVSEFNFWILSKQNLFRHV